MGDGNLALAVLPFGGCMVGPNYHLPPAPTPPAYKEVGDWKAAEPSDDKLGGKSSKIFQDPQLNALEEQIDVSNQNLKAAFAQYQQSRAVLRQYRADLYPTVTANLQPDAPDTRTTARRTAQPLMGLLLTILSCLWNWATRLTSGAASVEPSSLTALRRRPALPISRRSISACIPTWLSITSQPAVWTPKKSFCRIVI